MAKIRVAVLFGGVSSEHDVSLVSAENVIRSIPKEKYEVLVHGNRIRTAPRRSSLRIRCTAASSPLKTGKLI